MQNNQGKSNANSTENINKIIEKKINSYVEKQENDMGDLTSLVEEIANRIIDENKKITQRLNEQEDNYTAEEYEQERIFLLQSGNRPLSGHQNKTPEEEIRV